MMETLVSVIIPAYNASKTIVSCIKSVVNQTYKHYEIIVVDDGSKDDTVVLINNYVEQNNIANLIVITQKNSGPSTARNRGIQLAKGDFIAFLDSDDEWLPTKLYDQVKLFISNPWLKMSGTNYLIGDQNVSLGEKVNEAISFNQLLYKNYFITSTVMCRREVFSQLNFNVNQKYSEDYRLWLEILALGEPAILLNKPLTRMYDKPMFGAIGLSAKIWAMEKGELSNFYYLYQKKIISFCKLNVASTVSLLKYLRRVCLTYYSRIVRL